MNSDYFSCHTHSEFSTLDGMNSVNGIVDRIAELGQPGIALTDHGLMGGVVQGYKRARKHGLAFYPGEEFYVVRDVHDPDTRGERFHLGMMALDFKGYSALTRLSTLSWSADRFYRKPLIDLSDLAFLHDEGYADHIAVTTGCYFGLVIDRWKEVGLGPQLHAANMMDMLAGWFPNTLYVEVQNHGITQDGGYTDLDIAKSLYGIAQHKGLPVVIGGDSHYIHASEQPVHDLMKGICYFGDGEDSAFPGGPYHLLSADEAMGAFPPDMRDALEDGHADLLNRNRLTLPALDTYKFRVPKMFDDPNYELSVLIDAAMRDKGLAGDLGYEAQVQHEGHVIAKMGMSNYFLLVKTHVTDWCRDNGIIVNARGSVNGSLVTYLLGISNVDPIVWNTSFDRFLSLDRLKPPDIDIDVDFRGRQRLIGHLRTVFPTMVQVGTYAKIGITSSEADDGSGEDTGSVYVQYMAAMRKKDPAFDGRVKREHRAALNAMADTPINKSMGTNAAGLILPGDDLPIDQYLPLARIVSSNTTLTQFNKDDVEALGYMKMDILGIRALQTLNGCLYRIGKPANEWDWISYDDVQACKLLRSGDGTGIFQFEGWSTANGGKEMKITSTLDVVICLALYRPALKAQKDLYLANRGKHKDRQIRLHQIFDVILNDTAGVPLFQEQIMEMLKAIGMGFKDWNDLMTAVKASNGFIQGAADTFARIQPIFYDLCEDRGLSYEQQDKAWGAVVGYTEYGFNRAHSTGYALMSYYGAFLKSHYPLEYMASVMDVWAGEKKEPIYTTEAKRLGFSIVKADVNLSGASWDVDLTRPKALRKGLVCLKGIGENVAEAIVEARGDVPFTSVQDFIDRTPARPVTGGREYKKTGELVGVCKTLLEAGAFRSLAP